MEGLDGGKVQLMGIDVNISQVLGEKIVNQYIAQMSEEDMQKIMSYIEQDLWAKNYRGEKCVKVSERNYCGDIKRNTETLGDYAKEKFSERIKDEIAKKCEEIISSQDYKDKVEEIAQEIVDYATDGYKEDIKNRVRQRLVGNVFDSMPMYDNVDLVSIISDIVNSTLKSSTYTY